MRHADLEKIQWNNSTTSKMRSSAFLRLGFSVLLGIVFFLGGAMTAEAAWSFTYTKDGSSYTNSDSPTESACIIKKNEAVSGGGEVTSFCSGTDTVVATGTGGTVTGTSGTALTSGTGTATGTGDTGGTATGAAPGSFDKKASDKATIDFLLNSWKCGVFNLGSCFMSLILTGPTILLFEIYKIASWILIACAYFMDSMLSWSIEGPLINPTPAFINSSWTVVRDFSNMLFIFILIYTGIMTIFGEKDWKRTILWVVVIALLINFSLFFTKVVIDAGNVLAVGIKSSLTSSGKSISTSLAAAFEPQEFISTAGAGSMSDAMIIFAIAVIVNGFAAYIFFKVAILFSRRLIVFWALMVLSPFAFISVALPQKMNKFGAWLSALTSLTFVAPVFLFFLYLIIQIINAPGSTPGSKLLDIIKTPSTTWGDAFLVKILGPVMVAALLIKALQETLKFTEDFAGKAGEGFSNLVSGAMGIAAAGTAGVALGGAALLGRQVIGRGVSAMAGGVGEKLANSDNAVARWAGRRSLALADTAKTASFDVRNVGKVAGVDVGKYISKGFGAFGVDTKKGAGAWGVKGGKGGYEKESKNRAQAKEDADHKAAERLEMTDSEKETVNAKYGVKEKESEAKKQQQNVLAVTNQVKTAEESKKQIEKDAENSDEAILLTARQKQLKDDTDTAKKATADREAAQKAIKTTMDPVGAQKILDDAIMKESQALNVMKATQSLTEKANADYTAVVGQKLTDANNVLKSAQEGLEDAQKKAEDATREAVNAKTIASTEITNENARRREQYAKDTSGMFSSKTAKQARIDKIRKERTDTDRAEAKKRADSADEEDKKKEEEAKFFKELAKKMKEMEGGN
ncbi:MAG: hypothetical protein HZB12_00355 [Candidatus Yonathbacteria bacterium]|nr:hypothetical protein [Candidatus Yonathbacteria bacterium]